MKDNRQQPRRLDDHDDHEERLVWETPTIRAVGTIAELVQASKTSGDQDCGGKKRFGTGSNCGNS